MHKGLVTGEEDNLLDGLKGGRVGKELSIPMRDNLLTPHLVLGALRDTIHSSWSIS